ncbi:hypothetical protein [Nostoc sp.]
MNFARIIGSIPWWSIESSWRSHQKQEVRSLGLITHADRVLGRQ